MVQRIIQREIQRKKDNSDRAEYAAFYFYDTSAGERYFDVQTSLYVSPGTSGIVIGKEYPHAAGVLGVRPAEHSRRNTHDCTLKKTA